MVKVEVVPISLEHEEAAYAIWHNGMSTDLVRLFIEHYARQRRIWLVLILIFSLFTYAGYSLFGAAIVVFYWTMLSLGCWLES